MYKTVDEEIKNALVKKGYTWKEISIRSFLGYTNQYEVKLDGKIVEIYDCKKKAFFD